MTLTLKCPHKHITTPRHDVNGDYIRCLDCTKRIPFELKCECNSRTTVEILWKSCAKLALWLTPNRINGLRPLTSSRNWHIIARAFDKKQRLKNAP